MPAEPRFYLKDKTSSTNTPIIMRWFLNGKRFVLTVGPTVKPSLWSAKNEKVMQRHLSSESYNTQIELTKQAAIKAYTDLMTEKGAVNFTDLRNRIKIATGKKKGSDTLLSFIDTLIQERTESNEYKPQTIKGYRQMRSKLEEFAVHEKKEEFDFVDMDYQFFVRFKAYLQDQDFTNSYTKKIIDRLRVFLNEATRRKINKHTDYQLATVKITADESNEIYLTKQELEQLYHLDLSGNPRQDRARDLFLIGAFTGLRLSDSKRLTLEHIKSSQGFEIIKIVTKKTKQELSIPLHAYVKSILNKYGGSVPKMTDVELNRVIKQIGKDSGFLNEKINFKRHEGGEMVVKQVPRWKMLKSHTGRRSFATNAYLEGWSSIAIMHITGHKTETNFMKYIRVTKDQNAVAISKHEAYKLAPENAKIHEVLILAKQNADKWGLTVEELEVLESIRAKANKASNNSPLRLAK